MFMGEYSHSIDPKGRLIIPAKLREELGDNFVVTKGLDGCLFAYPQEEWQNIEKRFREVPLTTKDARKFSRFFFAGAAQMELDKQGRILLPATLRSFAGLEKDVVLVGVLDRVEIWDKSRWDENNAYDDQDMDEIAEHMADLGLSI
ncbi:division/cell wall cluster transcriptional repressor MraZ [Lachnospiraceae bacterium YH-ros2228]|jgi:MraZ protein|nr:division/cell wall cluster transcriptional repressor MraZ [Lachnospiraceae bacterium]MDD6451902.1 division/cell wall cluster transcriptional repressor MraZ [Lachnospiraceae bacterium]MDD6577762.1 division/cell wall cluster transcriptional repressor MraZ [Lachnospiraceae bacterium]